MESEIHFSLSGAGLFVRVLVSAGALYVHLTEVDYLSLLTLSVFGLMGSGIHFRISQRRSKSSAKRFEKR